MRLLRLLCSSLVFAASVSASNASQPHSGQLEAGQEILLPLAVKTGDYIEASLDTPQARVNLDLLASDGHAVRRLLQASIGSGVFRFIAQPGQTLRLGGTVSTTPYTLRITRQVSVAEQKLPPEPLASPALRELAADLTKGGSTDAFWARMAHEGTPLIEAAGNGQYRVTFLWRGAKHGVRLFGGPARDHDELQRLGQSDVWFRSYTVPANARASYRLAPDVPVFAGNPRERRVAILATAQADPLNPRRWPGDAPDRFTQQSVLELPEAPLQAWITPTGAASGSLQSWLQESRILGNTHDIALYRPAGFDPGNPANLLLFVFDGPEYQSRVPTPTILDNLVAAGRLPPPLLSSSAMPAPRLAAWNCRTTPTLLVSWQRNYCHVWHAKPACSPGANARRWPAPVMVVWPRPASHCVTRSSSVT
ncbi:MAG: hypothetical protein CGU29_05980 [Candidatus Dactylopiibacterium carminicum]|uniref:DUF3327 domain-containing protein n=1 Tax=Candidatus Dactylopiibacterium carminicum TaxID=857335 RepID=A0A272EUL1_9RHOO|nr:DUF3327 domain-containing protein [Candidatus Dactylopiibacterium carminicum]PAS93783.1 MAG: hypothetical protein CGU29_05980 [Candidatus Dactylopiibacterium carminicum]